jgi:DNA-binding CsgD family transcriptional regulator
MNVDSAPASFVGRQSELRILDERLAAARLGRPQVVLVEGAPGAGKSTLLSRFLGSVSDAVIVEVGGDEAEMLLSYGVIDQLRLQVRTEPGMDPMAVGGQLLDHVERWQADGQVVVLAVDDLQWADRPSSRAVLFALRRLRTDRVLTVLATRVGGVVEQGWARFVAGDSRVTRIRLGGLSSEDLTELASALGLGTLSDQGATRLATHTQGNALYCRALLDEIGVVGLSAAADGGLPAPRELSALILGRAASLPATTQAFLEAAAVLGQHALMATIAAVAALADVRRDVDAAVGAGLLAEGAQASELSFVHPLFRAAIYGDIGPMRRRELHGRAARLLAGRVRLVHLVAASSGPDESLATELERSAEADLRDGDAGAAAWALEQAALLSPELPDRERRLLDAVAVVLNAADTATAERILASCHLASARRDALTGLFGVFTGSPTARARLLAAWEGHDPTLDRETGARAATSLTNWMALSGRPDQGLTWADRAVDATVPGSPLRAMARTAQAYAFAAAGRSRDGLRMLDFLPPFANEVAMPETDALIMRGMLKVYVDDLPGAIADLSVAAARVRTGLSTTYPGPCLAHLSDAHFRRGDWDTAVAQAELAASAAQDADRPLDLARGHGQAAQIHARRGDWAAAHRHASAARAAAERFPLVVAVAAAGLAGATLASSRGDLLGVLAAVEPIRASSLLGTGGCPGIFNWRAIEVDALIGLGRLAEAAAALDAYEPAVPDSGLASAALSVARCRGNLAVASEAPIGAEAAFGEAHLIKKSVPMPFEHGLLALDDGRRLRTYGHLSAAAVQLEMAHRLFTELGAAPYVESAAGELSAVELAGAADSSEASYGLSAAELAVARLAAAGQTNREVAQELFVSVKTVEYHLHNIYLKLGISSRRGLPSSLR